jgi:uncharacterized membrane protein
MDNDAQQWATLVTALGCGLAAGVFFAFSSFVMPALRRLPPAEGIAAMQSINRLALTPVFMTALFGTALACVGLAVVALLHLGDRFAGYTLAGCALYLLGPIGLTIVYHAPNNDRLDTVDAHDARAAGRWTRYEKGWTAWNHVRAVGALAAAGLLTVALRVS